MQLKMGEKHHQTTCCHHEFQEENSEKAIIITENENAIIASHLNACWTCRCADKIASTTTRSDNK